MSVIIRIAISRLLNGETGKDIAPVQRLQAGEWVPVPLDDGEFNIGFRRRRSKMTDEQLEAAEAVKKIREATPEEGFAVKKIYHPEEVPDVIAPEPTEPETLQGES